MSEDGGYRWKASGARIREARTSAGQRRPHTEAPRRAGGRAPAHRLVLGGGPDAAQR